MDTFGGAIVAPLQDVIPAPLTQANGASNITLLFGNAPLLLTGANANNEQHQYNVVATTSVQEGAHSVKFGVDYRRLSPVFDPGIYVLFANFASVAQLEDGSTSFTQILSDAGATFLFHNLAAFESHLRPQMGRGFCTIYQRRAKYSGCDRLQFNRSL
jgi:hypothetical protein